eukprot:m.108169 g.108169  ORF g.108169 m.108169 type:complete len:550 (+) comp12793_c0_seq7:42-1691(+)
MRISGQMTRSRVAFAIGVLFVNSLNLCGALVRKNFLYIISDDLRAELPPLHNGVHAPNLAKLSADGLSFDRAYCNQPVCSPSRNSFMSGRRPGTTKVWNFLTSFRAVGPRWTTLPSHFLSNGYLTLGTGKLYHEGQPENGDGNLSWSNVPVQFSCNKSTSTAGGASTYCDPAMPSCDVPGTNVTPNPRWCAIDAPLSGDGTGDPQTLVDAIKKLRFASANRNATGQPFFLGVGFHLPHLDWRVPRGWLDLYPPAQATSPAAYPTAQKLRPPISIHCPYESQHYENLWVGWGYTNPWSPMRNASAQEMRLFYRAATSFMDSMVGDLLQELDNLGLTDDTGIVFHSDHGFSLGENGDWKKFTLTELGTRVPLIFKIPWLPHLAGTRTQALAELVDIFPTLSDLAQLPPPSVHPGDVPLDGVSLFSLFQPNPPKSIKPFIYSQYPRCPLNITIPENLWERNLCIEIPSAKFGWMGYSLRTDVWRYTAWFPWNGSALRPILPISPVNGSQRFYNELFQYNSHSNNLDVVDRIEVGMLFPEVVKELHATLIALL